MKPHSLTLSLSMVCSLFCSYRIQTSSKPSLFIASIYNSALRDVILYITYDSYILQLIFMFLCVTKRMCLRERWMRYANAFWLCRTRWCTSYTHTHTHKDDAFHVTKKPFFFPQCPMNVVAWHTTRIRINCVHILILYAIYMVYMAKCVWYITAPAQSSSVYSRYVICVFEYDNIMSSYVEQRDMSETLLQLALRVWGEYI